MGLYFIIVLKQWVYGLYNGAGFRQWVPKGLQKQILCGPLCSNIRQWHSDYGDNGIYASLANGIMPKAAPIVSGLLGLV